MIETLKTFIKEQLQNTKEYLVEYTPEKLANSKTYAALYIANTALAEQLEQRADELELAYEHESNRAKLLEEEAAQKREEEGWWNAVLAVGTIVIGTVAIVCTAGAATPIVVTAAIAGGSTIAYGTSNLIEASQDIYYGSIGDAHTVAFNPIRDTIFMGNQEAYDLWGGISTTVAGLIVPVGQTYTAAKAVGQTGKTLIGTVGKSAVKEVAQDTLVGAASSKAGGLVMDVTGDANLSRLAGLGTGILSGSKTGKALNSIDSAVSSSVKTLNHIDDVADVTKAFDDAADSAKPQKSLKNSGLNSKTTIDYSYKFDRELVNFNDGYEIKSVVDKDLILVQFSSDAPDASLCYWTTIDEANGITTLDEYMDKLALSKEWGKRNTVKVSRIPAGTKVKHAVGTAREQLLINDPRPGGGVQYLFNEFDTNWISEVRNFPD